MDVQSFAVFFCVNVMKCSLNTNSLIAELQKKKKYYFYKDAW